MEFFEFHRQKYRIQFRRQKGVLFRKKKKDKLKFAVANKRGVIMATLLHKTYPVVSTRCFIQQVEKGANGRKFEYETIAEAETIYSYKDRFNKERGRKISFGRALRIFAEKQAVIYDNLDKKTLRKRFWEWYFTGFRPRKTNFYGKMKEKFQKQVEEKAKKHPVQWKKRKG